MDVLHVKFLHLYLGITKFSYSNDGSDDCSNNYRAIHLTYTYTSVGIFKVEPYFLFYLILLLKISLRQNFKDFNHFFVSFSELLRLWKKVKVTHKGQQTMEIPVVIEKRSFECKVSSSKWNTDSFFFDISKNLNIL